jgi:hypothetical protein
MRRPARVALRAGAELARAAVQDADARRALLGTLARLPAALRQRMPPSLEVERELRMLEDATDERNLGVVARRYVG